MPPQPENSNHPLQATKPALVCFTGETELRWLRFLKPGFRHCLALVEQESCWTVYNPLSNRTALDVIPPRPVALLRRQMEEMGYKVVETRAATTAPLRLAPLFPFSCVEAVKRLLGIHNRQAFTPWRLYTLLNRQDLRKQEQEGSS